MPKRFVMSIGTVPRHESYISLAYSKSGIWADDDTEISNWPHVTPTYLGTLILRSPKLDQIQSMQVVHYS